MSIAGTIGWTPGRSILARLLRSLSSFLFSGAVLGWVATQAGPRDGLVLVHVTEPDVIVTIGDRTFTIKDRGYAPIGCTLPVGRHSLLMSRGGQVLYAEDFNVRGGQDLILTAWDPAGRLETCGSRRALDGL